MKFIAPLAAACLLSGLAAPALAAVVVVDFEDHPGSERKIEDGYAGIDWGGAFLTYDTASDPFTPRSGTTAAYFNYKDGGMEEGKLYTRAFTFSAPVLFLGAWFAGDAVPVAFEFYLDGVFQGSTSTGVSATPMFLAGLGKAVNEVRVRGGAGNFVMDDVTFDTDVPVTAVPEPGVWAMMILGFGAAGAVLRRRRAAALAG